MSTDVVKLREQIEALLSPMLSAKEYLELALEQAKNLNTDIELAGETVHVDDNDTHSVYAHLEEIAGKFEGKIDDALQYAEDWPDEIGKALGDSSINPTTNDLPRCPRCKRPVHEATAPYSKLITYIHQRCMAEVIKRNPGGLA